MLNEVLACLSPAEDKKFVDGTFGAGGYTSALLNAGARVLAIDRDPNAIKDGAEMVTRNDGRLVLMHGEFADMNNIAESAGFSQADGVVLDIGVSSMQLDEAERGFSFQKEGPLDMRMSQTGVTVADVVNRAKQSDLTRIIGLLGEEKKASLVSREIVKARAQKSFDTTLELARIVEKTIGRKAQDKIHPATRTFQALRIFVNQELHQLARALFAAERLLKAGGHLVVVTFHSLEDRIVKLFIRDRLGGQQGSRHLPSVEGRKPVLELVKRGLLFADAEEAKANPRARSAKLRWAIRTDAEPFEPDMSIFGLPDLPQPEKLAEGAG